MKNNFLGSKLLREANFHYNDATAGSCEEQTLL